MQNHMKGGREGNRQRANETQTGNEAETKTREEGWKLKRETHVYRKGREADRRMERHSGWGWGGRAQDWGHPDTNGMGRRDCCDWHGLTALRAKKGDEL